MKLEVIVNSDEVVDGLKHLRGDMPRILMACVVHATTMLYRNSREQMDKIYNTPIPVSPRTGKPYWKRTSNLLNNERQEFKQLSNGAVGRIYNNAKSKKGGGEYAEWRHELNTPSPIDGINRHVPWRDLAIAAKGDEAMNVFKKTLGDEIDARWTK